MSSSRLWRAVTLTASSSERSTSPTSVPSPRVTGALRRSCSRMYSSICATLTFGRNVLGPGRMTSSARASPFADSSLVRMRPRTTRASFTTSGTPLIELLQWDVDRAREMLLSEVLSRQDLDELRTARDERAHLTAVDDLRHQPREPAACLGHLRGRASSSSDSRAMTHPHRAHQ